jgi:uncharacterized Fe-S radical SAM superfamily protein PflX
MTEEELEKEAIAKYKTGSYPQFHPDHYAFIHGYLAGAEPREKRITVLSERCTQLQKDKGELTDKVNELERKYQELVDKLHNCWFCKKSCPLGKRIEAEKKKCEDWELTFGIND